MEILSGNHFIRFLLILLIAGTFQSCTKYTYQKEGVWHTLKPGETLENVSNQYSVSIHDIRQINDIYDPQDLSPGARIFIPEPKKEKIEISESVKQPVQQQARFSWPSQGTISSGFGMRHGKMHEGIDITKDKGRDIRAAGNGVVEFAGYKSGYGQTIIINHGGEYKTLYAHNAKLYVKRNTKVNQGVIIARMGSTGKSIGIHLHFEVRYRGKPQNPLRYLPIR